MVWRRIVTFASWDINRFFQEWGYFTMQKYHGFEKCIHCIAYATPNCKLDFFSKWGNHINQYMLEPILLPATWSDPLLEWDVPWSKHSSSKLCIITRNKALCDVYAFNGPTYDFMLFLDGYFSFMGQTLLCPWPTLSLISRDKCFLVLFKRGSLLEWHTSERAFMVQLVHDHWEL